MPPEVETSTHIFQWQNQKLRFTTARTARMTGSQFVEMGCTLEVTQVNPISGYQEFVPSDELVETIKDNLMVANVTVWKTNPQMNGAMERRTWINNIRSAFRYNIKRSISYAWTEAVPQITGGTWWAEASYWSSIQFDILMDKLSDFLVDDLKVYLDIPCPDDVASCYVFHDESLPHVTAYSGTTAPAENMIVRGYNGDQEVILYISPGSTEQEVTNNWRASEVISPCGHCGDNWQMFRLSSWINVALCDECSANSITCDSCNGHFREDEVEETERYDEDRWYTEEWCYLCIGSDSRNLNLQNWSYRPSFIFHETAKEKEDMSVLFMGMEIEVARTGVGETRRVNDWIRALPETILYAKSDSSVNNGMEVVTHPMTYNWAKANFPFLLFDKLAEIPTVLTKHPSAGTHVHMSKSAFTNTHLWKFIKFHLDLPEFAGLIGERGVNADYGSLISNSSDIRRDLMTIAKADKTEGIDNYSRSVGINLRPDETIELRYLAGNAESKGIKKNLQWVQAVYDYTKAITFRDAVAGAFKDPGYFLGFIEDYNYGELQEFIDRLLPTKKKLERSS